MAIFVSKEDILHFLSEKCKERIGVCYSREKEDVHHLFLIPQKHTYGKETKAFFTLEKPNFEILAQKEFSHIVQIFPEEPIIHVFSLIENEWKHCDYEYIPTQGELYSRNKGLIELDILKDKHVTIVGLGSFGSQIAIELAKAGLGRFSLFDFDRVELHNLVRHSAFLRDLGRLKTDVLFDAIIGKNPYAVVELFPYNVTEHIEVLDEQVRQSDIVICATDNNQSRFYIAELLEKYNKIGIFGGAITRAEGGHVFLQRPGHACYCCLVGNDFFVNAKEEITNLESARRNGQIAIYSRPEDAEAMVQVGLSTDIEPLSNMVVKLSLVELSRGANSGISSLENEFIFNYYFWANRRDREYAHWAPFPNCGNKPTIMRWYGTQIPKNTSCAICSSHAKLDEGEYLNAAINKADLENVTIDFESAIIK